MSPTSLLAKGDAGGLHLAPLVGTADPVGAEYQLRWLDLVRENAIWALTGIVYSLLAPIAVSLFLFNPNDRVYFWMGALLLMMGLGGGETALAAWTQTVTVPTELWICYVLVIPAITVAWIMLLRAGLPLGLTAQSTYEESVFHQEENEQITLVTDGEVEARSASGELFGFERTAAIAAQPAESISKTAQDFGQDDDITVLTLTRLPVGKEFSSPQAATVLSPSIA